MSKLIDSLADRIHREEDFHRTRAFLYKKYFAKILGEDIVLEREEVNKFAFSVQILSKSSNIVYIEEGRKYLAMLLEVCADDFPELYPIAKNLFVEHGDFPNLPLLHDRSTFEFEFNPITETRNAVRENINTIDGIEYPFTDFQVDLWNNLESNRDTIVVAPTSAGKTHVILTYLVRRMIASEAGFYVIVVPTRALITEVASNVYEILNDHDSADIEVCTVPNKEEFHKRTIFVMTQERLYELVLRGDLSFDLLFIDEAHNISERGRGVLLHMTIERILEDSSPQLIVSMPSKSYGAAYSSVFPKSEFGLVASDHLTVSKVMINVVPKGRKLILSDLSGQSSIEASKGFKGTDTADIVLRLGKDQINLVFSNKTNNCEDLASRISQRIRGEVVVSSELEEAAEYIRELIHPEFTLADNLLQEVAFHYGPLPTSARVMVESLARRGLLKYIVCTSTLAEGINLPAKNLFLKNPLIPIKGKPSERMKNVQMTNIVGRAGRMTKHFSGNVFLIEPSTWEFDDYFSDEAEEVKIPGYQASINNDFEDLLIVLSTGNVPEGREDLYSIANKLLKDYGRNALFDVLSGELIELDDSQKDRMKKAVEAAYMGMDVPIYILESNPTVGYIQQNNLYLFLSSVTDLESWLTPHPRAKDLYERLVVIFDKLKELDVYVSSNTLTIPQLCIITYKWIGSNPLSEIILDQIGWDARVAKENSSKPPKVNSSVRKVIKSINDDVRFRMSNAMKCYVDIINFVASVRDLDISNVSLHYYMEIGSSIDYVVSLINLGVSRETALMMYDAFGSDKLISSKEHLKLALSNAEAAKLNKIAIQEIENLIG